MAQGRSQSLERRTTAWQAVLGSEDSYATTLLISLTDRFGAEMYTWAPETIRREVLDEFRVRLPDICLDRIMAGIMLVTTDDFYQQLPRFIQLCNVLSDDQFDPFTFDPADVLEVAWGITEAMLLSPPEDPETAFTDEIRHYIGAIAAEEHLVNPPDVLALALRDSRNPDPLSELSDDPQMYQAFWKSQAGKDQEITDTLRQRLAELFRQVDSLPLQHGDKRELLQRIRREPN